MFSEPLPGDELVLIDGSRVVLRRVEDDEVEVLVVPGGGAVTRWRRVDWDLHVLGQGVAQALLPVETRE